MRGVSKHRRTAAQIIEAKKNALAKTVKAEKPADLDIRAAASLMGKKGGLSKSELKLARTRERAKTRRPRRVSYTYAKKVKAKLGLRGNQTCFIPDQVAETPEKHKGKSFKALWGEKKISVIFIPANHGYHVIRFWSREQRVAPSRKTPKQPRIKE